MADVSISLTKFKFDPDASDDAPILVMEGRNNNWISFLLSFLGLTEDSSLTVSRKELRFRFSNLRGITYIVCPLDALTCSIGGVQKRMWMLVIGILALLVGAYGILSASIGGLISLVAIFVGMWVIYMFLKTKHVILTFSTGDIGDMHGLAFESTTINGRSIGVDEVLEASNYINHLI